MILGLLPLLLILFAIAFPGVIRVAFGLAGLCILWALYAPSLSAPPVKAAPAVQAADCTTVTDPGSKLSDPVRCAPAVVYPDTGKGGPIASTYYCIAPNGSVVPCAPAASKTPSVLQAATPLSSEVFAPPAAGRPSPSSDKDVAEAKHQKLIHDPCYPKYGTTCEDLEAFDFAYRQVTDAPLWRH